MTTNTSIARTKVMLAFVLILLCNTSYSQIKIQTDSLNAKVDSWLPKINQKTPGYALGVMHKGKIVYQKVSGSANLELNVPLSNESVFNIGSVSKQFTGFAIVQLAEIGKLRLTDKASIYLPEFDILKKHPITIAHLMHHTSGLREMFELLEVSDYQVSGITMDQVKQLLVKQQKLNFKPGSSFQYINTNYFFLALIIEKVSGISFPEYLQNHIFEPLKMTTATVLDSDQKLLPNRTAAYIKSATNFIRANPTDNFYGPGSIYCSISDLMKWGSSVIDKKIGNENLYKQFLQTGVVKENRPLKYASGVYVDSYKGINIIEHDGSRVGYTSQIVMAPEMETVIVILANSRSFPVRDISRKMMDHIFNGQFIEQKKTEPVKQSIPSLISLNEKTLQAYTGYYWNQESDLRRMIYLKDDTLRYQRTAGNESAMLPVAANTFILKMGSTVTRNTLSFSKNAQKKWNIIFVAESGDSSFFIQVDSNKSSLKDLDQYAGKFFCDEIDAKFEIKKVGGNLILNIKGWDHITMINGFKDYFYNVDFGGSIFFNRNTKGRITSFKYTSPKTRNLEFLRMRFEN